MKKTHLTLVDRELMRMTTDVGRFAGDTLVHLHVRSEFLLEIVEHGIDWLHRCHIETGARGTSRTLRCRWRLEVLRTILVRELQDEFTMCLSTNDSYEPVCERLVTALDLFDMLRWQFSRVVNAKRSEQRPAVKKRRLYRCR